METWRLNYTCFGGKTFMSGHNNSPIKVLSKKTNSILRKN